MPAILTVDDSRAVRTIVGKQVRELGFEVLEAEDGAQGLAVLQDTAVDLILLDVTMPNMDGPEMLQQLRSAGNPTPVIMLTSESKRSVVAGAMKLGISDYILKPFKPEELRAKVLSVLQGEPGVATVAATGGAEAKADPGDGPRDAVGVGGRFVDVLLVDDMENVQKKLRALLPGHVSLLGTTSAQQALATCRDRVFRVILVDTEIPDVNSAVLCQQLRMLQPHAALVAMSLRSANDTAREARELGFDDVLLKPFRPEGIDDFLLQYFDNQDFLQQEDNVLRIAPFSGRADRVERFYGRLAVLFPPALDRIAAACYDEIVLDVGAPPLEGDRLPKLVHAMSGRCRELGMTLSIVAPPDARKVLGAFTETREIRAVGTVEEARAGAA